MKGYSTDEATQRLKNAGFKPVEYPIECGSNIPPGYVAYNGPGYAAPSSEVYYCVSNGNPLTRRGAQTQEAGQGRHPDQWRARQFGTVERHAHHPRPDHARAHQRTPDQQVTEIAAAHANSALTARFDRWPRVSRRAGA